MLTLLDLEIELGQDQINFVLFVPFMSLINAACFLSLTLSFILSMTSFYLLQFLFIALMFNLDSALTAG